MDMQNQFNMNQNYNMEESKKSNKNILVFGLIISIVVVGVVSFIIINKNNTNNNSSDTNNDNNVEKVDNKVMSEDDKKELAKKLAVDWINTYISFNEYCDSIANVEDKQEMLKLAEKWLEDNVKPKLDKSSIYLNGNTYERGSINDVNKLVVSGYFQFMASLNSWKERYTIDDVSSVKITHQDTTDSDIAGVYFKSSSNIPPVAINLDEGKINATSLKKDTINLGANRVVVIIERDATLKINGVDIKSYFSKWQYSDVVKEYTNTISSNQEVKLSIDLENFNSDNYEFYCIPLVYAPFEYVYERNDVKKTIKLEDFESVGNVVKSTSTWNGSSSTTTDTNLIVMTQDYIK